MNFRQKIHEIQYAFNAVCPINFEDTAAMPKGPAPHKSVVLGLFFAIPVHSCATKIESVFIEDLMPKSTFGMKAYLWAIFI